MNKISINQYSINSPLLSNKQRMAFISDIHGDEMKLELIVDILKKLQVSIILLGGDLIDSNKDNNKNDKIKELLQELSKTVNIFVSIGNHDMVYFDKNLRAKNREVESRELEFWKSLNSINGTNLHISSLPIDNPTINKWTLNNDIDIFALNLPIEYYWRKELSIEFYNYLEIIKSISINAEKFNILLCHSPKNIIKDGKVSDYLDYLKKFNLILSGHMHGGLVPQCIRNQSFGRGFVGPYASILPSHAYGIVKTDNTISLTTGGVTKIASSSEIGFLTNNNLVAKLVDFVYLPELEILNLSPGEVTTLKKVR